MITQAAVNFVSTPALTLSPTLTLYMQEFPTAERWDVLNALKYIFSIQFIQVLVLNYVGPMIRMAQEKEKGIKHALLLKGMMPVAFWSTWFISESITVFLSTCVTVSCLYACELFIYTNAAWVFLAFLLFGCAFVCFGFLCSFLAEKAYSLAMFAGLFNMLTLALFAVTQFYFIDGNKVDQHVIHLLFLIAPVPFGHIIYEILNQEIWKKAWTPDVSPYAATAYAFLAADTVIYFILCVIIENSKDFYNVVGKKGEEDDKPLAVSHGIMVRGLKKKFVVMEKNEYGMKRNKVVQAVNGLDLTVAEKTIFCLLGHNGAGKTTTMSLITGALYPDEGWMTVGGLDVVKERSQLRKSLGVCPQFDVLYDELTVWEHMQLYGGMQGLTQEQCDAEAERLLADLDLLVKKTQKSSNMSGGQQRRLSLAVSLIGAPRVVNSGA